MLVQQTPLANYFVSVAKSLSDVQIGDVIVDSTGTTQYMGVVVAIQSPSGSAGVYYFLLNDGSLFSASTYITPTVTCLTLHQVGPVG